MEANVVFGKSEMKLTDTQHEKQIARRNTSCAPPFFSVWRNSVINFLCVTT